MDKNTIQQNLVKIISFYKEKQAGLYELYDGVKNPGEKQKVLDEFLDILQLEKNDETRFISYSRIVEVKEDPLKLFLKNNNTSEREKNKLLDTAYVFTKKIHENLQQEVIEYLEKESLITEFYLEIFKWVFNVGKAFSSFYIPWNSYIVDGVNKDLEERFEEDSEKILAYLWKEKLFDLGYNGDIADRSYSALVLEDGKYISKPYKDIFPKEIGEIIASLDEFIKKLEKLEDEIYNQKNVYIEYLQAIKKAFEEKDVNKLVERWGEVDVKWMSITSPFQIVHPLEYYGDKYRKAVTPDWDLRILDTESLESDVEENIMKMYEWLYEEIGRENFEKSYNFSLANIKRVQLYVSVPVLYFGGFLTRSFSAQVVPNDPVVSDEYGKKIYAFPSYVLESQRKAPFMKLQNMVLSDEIISDYRKFLFGLDSDYYSVYDVETIGHEFGHNLWLDLDTEVKMNEKTGVYKDIEEFKATASGLVAYFIDGGSDLDREILITHIVRVIGLLKFRDVEDIIPYYTEALIHFDILCESGILYIGDDMKIELAYSDENWEKLKWVYMEHYTKLVFTYLNKLDAGEFLFQYVEKEGKIYLPKDERLREFVEHYYKLYKKYGNEVDEEANKDDYLF